MNMWELALVMALWAVWLVGLLVLLHGSLELRAIRRARRYAEPRTASRL